MRRDQYGNSVEDNSGVCLRVWVSIVSLLQARRGQRAAAHLGCKCGAAKLGTGCSWLVNRPPASAPKRRQRGQPTPGVLSEQLRSACRRKQLS